MKPIVQITSIFSFVCLCSRNWSPKAFPALSKRPIKQASQVCFVMVLLQGNCGYQPDMLKSGESVISGLVIHARLKATQNFDKFVYLAFAWPFGPPFTRKYGKELFSNDVESTQLNTVSVSQLLYKKCTVSLFPSSLFFSPGSSRFWRSRDEFHIMGISKGVLEWLKSIGSETFSLFSMPWCYHIQFVLLLWCLYSSLT